MDSEDIAQRHRKEKKELQAKIQALKKSAVKGDKKKKREVQEEILKLEADLEKRHAEELSKLKVAVEEQQAENPTVNNVADHFNNLSTAEEEASDDVPGLKQQRITKAQKRREKKAIQTKERELRIIEHEAEILYGARNIETETIKNILKKRGLMIHEIPSDGNCLYCAVDHQLKECKGLTLGVENLRMKTGQVLRQNYNEYLPFLSHPDTGEMFTESQFYNYCDQVVQTSAWGGQVELRALSEALKCCIEVIQAEGPPIVIGEIYSKDGEPRLVLTYHRRMYSLGEHYNSVIKYAEEPIPQPC